MHSTELPLFSLGVATDPFGLILSALPITFKQSRGTHRAIQPFARYSEIVKIRTKTRMQQFLPPSDKGTAQEKLI